MICGVDLMPSELFTSLTLGACLRMSRTSSVVVCWESWATTVCTCMSVVEAFTAMVLMLPILMLSGLLFPIENLPKFFQIISNIVPARWYIDAIRKMMIQGAPLLEVWVNGTVLFGMTVVLLGVSFKKFNDKLE